jgi:hypothetical protein
MPRGVPLSRSSARPRRLGTPRRMSADHVRRGKVALSSGCKSHPANSLPPEATGAGMEVTKWLKPSISVSRFGDRASGQAATRVNAEQTSHGVVQVKSVIVRGHW